jgi:hypothetical protein
LVWDVGLTAVGNDGIAADRDQGAFCHKNLPGLINCFVV